MLRGKVVGPVLFVLALVAADTSMAQQKNQQPQQPNASSMRQQQNSEQRRIDEAGKSWDRGYDNRATTEKIDLPRVRAYLTQEWQNLGMSPQDAKMIASALSASDANGAKALPLNGKSDDEIASMLQSALAARNYVLADQLMINYERKRFLSGGKSVSRGDN